MKRGYGPRTIFACDGKATAQFADVINEHDWTRQSFFRVCVKASSYVVILSIPGLPASKTMSENGERAFGTSEFEQSSWRALTITESLSKNIGVKPVGSI